MIQANLLEPKNGFSECVLSLLSGRPLPDNGYTLRARNAGQPGRGGAGRAQPRRKSGGGVPKSSEAAARNLLEGSTGARNTREASPRECLWWWGWKGAGTGTGDGERVRPRRCPGRGALAQEGHLSGQGLRGRGEGCPVDTGNTTGRWPREEGEERRVLREWDHDSRRGQEGAGQGEVRFSRAQRRPGEGPAAAPHV